VVRFCLWVGFKARNKLLIYYGISKLVFLELYHGFVVFSFASWAMVKFFFKDIPLDSDGKGTVPEGEEG